MYSLDCTSTKAMLDSLRDRLLSDHSAESRFLLDAIGDYQTAKMNKAYRNRILVEQAIAALQNKTPVD